MAARFSPTVAWGSAPVVRLAIVLTTASLTLAFLGPFGTTTAMRATARIPYFITAVMTIGAIAWLAAWLVGRFGAALAAWQQALAVAVISTVPGTYVVEACLALWAPESLARVTPAWLTLQVFVLTLVLSLVVFRVLPQDDARGAAGGANVADGPAGLSGRLPLALRLTLPVDDSLPQLVCSVRSL
jgi:hypothetical protein